MKNYIKIQANVENLTQQLAQIFKNIPDNCETVLEFEKGTYHIGADGCDEHPIFASSSSFCDGRLKKVAFPLLNSKNITIDGNGSDFVFCDRIQPFFIQRCENVTLKNFSIDFAFLRYAFAKVLNADAQGLEVLLDHSIFDYETKDGDIIFKCGKENLSTKDRKISTKAINRKEAGIVFLYSQNATDVVRNQAAPNVVFLAEDKGDGKVYIKYVDNTEKTDFIAGDILCLAYDNDREAQSFFCEHCKNIKLENVSIYRQGGMGFVADVCENITIDNLKIDIKQGRNEYYSTTADGIYLTNCSGKFGLKNSRICNTYDDAINIHGYYMGVEKIIAKNRAEFSHSFHKSHEGIVPFHKGDVLRFSNPETMDEICSAVVKNITFDEKTRKNIIVTFEKDVELEKGMIVENRSSMPDVLFENNTVVNCPHIRLSAPDMIIKNNKLSLNGTDIYINDLFTFWAEHGAVENVLIENNEFGDASYQNIHILSCRPETSNHQHKNITIRNNTFKKCEKEAIVIGAPVEKLSIKNNFFNEVKK